MGAEQRRGRRRFQSLMGAAVALAVLPPLFVFLYIGEWVGLGGQLVFLGLAGALVRTGATWARWGLSAWFGIAGIMLLLAGFVGSRLSLQPSIADWAPHVGLGVLYLVFATIFASSTGIGEWLESRHQPAREEPHQDPESYRR